MLLARRVGKTGQATTRLTDGGAAVGHTRWATPGQAALLTPENVAVFGTATGGAQQNQLCPCF